MSQDIITNEPTLCWKHRASISRFDTVERASPVPGRCHAPLFLVARDHYRWLEPAMTLYICAALRPSSVRLIPPKPPRI